MISKNLFLTGYRGCGKSSVGQLIARHLSLPFIDTDVQIEFETRKTITEIFSESGERTFRDLESEQIARLSTGTQPAVVSLGGGAILRAENRECISRLGMTVWLQASPENICDRISKDTNTQSRRPKLSKLGDLDEIRTILAQRQAWYEEVADMCISTDEVSMENVAISIVDWYRKNN